MTLDDHSLEHAIEVYLTAVAVEGKAPNTVVAYRETPQMFLGVAQEPVTVQQISAWTRLHQGQVKEAIKLWREFLEEENVNGKHHYRIYHASFQDFLKEQVDLVRYDGIIADYYLSLAGFTQ